MKKVPLSFYNRKDVLQIAKELLGKIVVSKMDGMLTSGRIVETEGYVGLTDKASHSFGEKRTARNEHMYADAGTAYIYVCYGIHQMLNVVTNEKNIPDAILIRAIEPLDGVEIMTERTGKENTDKTITKGPGNVGKALGIFKHHSGLHLSGDEIYFLDDGFHFTENEIGISKRIGVEGAGTDGLLPYRFYVKGNKYVSGRPNK